VPQGPSGMAGAQWIIRSYDLTYNDQWFEQAVSAPAGEVIVSGVIGSDQTTKTPTRSPRLSTVSYDG
jgi:hypothetical protein